MIAHLMEEDGLMETPTLRATDQAMREAVNLGVHTLRCNFSTPPTRKSLVDTEAWQAPLAPYPKAP